MSLSSTGICSRCGGRCTNLPGKRYPRWKLEEIHNLSCPGAEPRKTPRNKDEMIALLRGEQLEGIEP